MKKIITLLLNFFPASFQKTMGPAWEEAVESQLCEASDPWHKMQILTGIVFLHFFVSLPQSYCYSMLNFMKTTNEQPAFIDGHVHVMARIRQRTPYRLHGLGRFLLLFSASALTGFVFSVFISWPEIQSSLPVFKNLMISIKSLIAFSLIVLFSFIVLFFDKLRIHWRVLLLAFIVGFFAQTTLQHFEFENKQRDHSALLEYSALSSHIIQLPKTAHPDWYVQDTLKKEREPEFCKAAISQISLWKALRERQEHNVSDYSEGLVLMLLYNNLYHSYHCYSQSEYLHLLDTVAHNNQKALQAYRNAMPWTFRFLTLSTLSADNFVLNFETSPYSYCTATFNSKIFEQQLFPVNLEQNLDFCSNQPKTKPIAPRHWWEWWIMTPSFKKHIEERHRNSPRINSQSTQAIDAAIQRWIHENPTLLTDKPND